MLIQVCEFLALRPTQKYAYLSRLCSKVKPGTPNLQAHKIFSFINLIMNTLIEDVQLLDFSNNTKCEVRNI